jgi:drug/metabolite transporter (DMT)-like permease
MPAYGQGVTTTDLVPAVRVASPARAGAVLCLVSAAGFGVAAVIAKQAYSAGVTVPMMLTLRFGVAAALFWAIVAFRRPARPAPRVLAVCIGLGGIGYALQAALYFSALSWIDGSLTGLLLYLYPALVTLLAIMLRRERPERRRMAALACSGAGLLLILGTGASGRPVAAIGVVLAVGAAVAYAIYLTVAAGLPKDLDLFLLSAIVCSSAAVTMGAAAVATGTLRSPTADGWLWIVMLAVFSTVLPISLLFAGMRLVGAPTAAILSCAEPAVTVLTTAMIYGERLTAGQVVGGVVVLAAVVILQARRRGATSYQSVAGDAVTPSPLRSSP